MISMRILTIVVFLTATLAVANDAVADDSVLVALAKRTNRQASKTPVITNETLATSTGRISVASGDAKATPSAPSTTTATGAKVSVIAVPANPTGGTARNIPAQSTATNEAPRSSAANAQPQSTARAADASSTASNSSVNSSARYSEPQSTASPH